MTDKEKLFQERVNRFMTTADLQEPDRVPVLSLVDTYAIAYANSTVEECLENPEKEREIYGKIYKDIYFDGAMEFGFSRAMKVYDALGSSAYFISEDGVTLQHRENCPMLPEDYDEFIADYKKFTDNVFFKRKYPNLNKPYPENKEALKKAAYEAAHLGKKISDNVKYLQDMGIPLIAGKLSLAPLDIIFDFYRGFVGTTLDIRRVPEKIKEAAEILVDYSIGLATGGADKMDPFPWVMTPLHIPTYLGPEKFGKFYWPSYKKFLLAVHERGGKVFAALEGLWDNYYEYLQELPKGLMIATLERDDIFKAKKAIGNTITLSGGMPLDKLKLGTKQECIDYAKKLVDQCAPGGGYIFTTNLVLLSSGDANPENLKAVNEFVHEYGKY
ncbi:uroporphyrinogen decarboxylase family protein [Candidatus Contubernalis alkaliaceticus]|uniref:uroporphyrinogen decarboxylase family protein n=1 Tax=Candidatus Contubernalis alkaliaceticus TaxID=338645 RepID=UPI001F4C50CF|nr:uroporphyrinogen decarboxylase family protein [Candidatus Contubernalis alkalaceticus]UNC91348.1 hypothetical protein HUE98_04130 [Candidatus Contubernalis alkalaceticus]